MKYLHRLGVKVFVFFFPDPKSSFRLKMKWLVTEIVLTKRRLFSPFKKLIHFTKRKLKPLKLAIENLRKRLDPNYEKEKAEKLWSAAWSSKVVYRKKLFLKWSESIAPFLKRNIDDLPEASTPERKKFCLVARPGSSHFMEPVLRSISDNYEIFYQPYIDQDFIASADQYDYIWFEWGSAGWALSQFKHFVENTEDRRCALIIRVHDFELKRNDILSFTDWNVADRIVFINNSALNEFIQKVPTVDRDKLIFLPNVVSEGAFRPPQVIRKTSKNILINMIKITPRKGVDYALKAFNKLLSVDDSYTLTIRTTDLTDPDELKKVRKKIARLKLPVEKLMLRVDNEEELHGRSNDEIAFDVGTNFSVAQMYQDFDIIWSTSQREGFHYAIAEGILSGLLPVVRNWEWGQAKDFWEPYVKQDTREFVAETLRIGSLSFEAKQLEVSENKKFVLERFGEKSSKAELTRFLESCSGDPISKSDLSVQEKSRKKRVVFFAHNHLYAENPRGGEKSSAEVLRGLKDRGYECLVVVQNRKSKNLERAFFDHDMPLISLPGETFKLGIKEIMLWWQPDVAMVWEIPTLDMWDVCKSRNIPYIVFIRFWHIVAPPPYVNLLEQKQDPEFLKSRKPVFENAHTVISNSLNTAEVIQHLYQKDSVVSYVPVQKLEKIESEQKFVTLINPGKTMGAENLIYEIAKLLPDVQFKVYQGDPSNDLSENITHAPYCDKTYNYIFKDTKLFLFPFKGHPCGTGRVVFECYHLDIPVIGSTVAGLPEVIPKEHLISSTDDPAEWVEVIKQVLADLDNEVSKVKNIAEGFAAKDQLDIVYKSVEQAISDIECVT